MHAGALSKVKNLDQPCAHSPKVALTARACGLGPRDLRRACTGGTQTHLNFWIDSTIVIFDQVLHRVRHLDISAVFHKQLLNGSIAHEAIGLRDWAYGS